MSNDPPTPNVRRSVFAVWHWPFSTQGRRRIALVVGILLVLCMPPYWMIYQRTVKRWRGVGMVSVSRANPDGIAFLSYPTYAGPKFLSEQHWNTFAVPLFWPANWLERRLRPELWDLTKTREQYYEMDRKRRTGQ